MSHERWADGTRIWRDGMGHPHRVGGPAVEYPDGGKQWALHGAFHRDGGPAVEWTDRSEWWVDGKRHRVGGPAVEFGDSKSWWVHGRLVGGPVLAAVWGNP